MVHWSLLCITLGICFSANFRNIHGQQEELCEEEEDEVICCDEDEVICCEEDDVKDIKPKPNDGIEKYKQFYLQTENVNWFRAYELCRAEGKRLATISNEEESNRLKTMLNNLRTPPQSVWLSGSDLAHEGRFMWMSTGQPFTFTSWVQDSRAMDNWKNEEHCVHMYRYNDQGYRWNDINCKHKYYFICESY